VLLRTARDVLLTPGCLRIYQQDSMTGWQAMTLQGKVRGASLKLKVLGGEWSLL
jgi:hypothetical protein